MPLQSQSWLAQEVGVN